MEKIPANSRNSKFSTKNNKKKYIDRKLNNKVKLQLWEQKRQKNFQQKYTKKFKKNRITSNQEDVEKSHSSKDTGSHNKLSVFKAAQIELERREEQKKQLIAEKLKKKKEIEQAITAYKKKKAERFKKLSKKTKHGQPVMKDRLQLLFEEIKQKFSSENVEQ